MRGASREKFSMIRIRRISKIPSSFGQNTDVFTRCPYWLENDDTAYAMTMVDNTFGHLVPNGTMLYVTKRREPIASDLVILDLDDGSVVVRFIEKVNAASYDTVFYPGTGQDITKDRIDFKHIRQFGVVAGTRRI